MGTLFAELKRRHIYRVAAAYAVVAWVLIQLVNNIAPMLKLPDWIGPAVLVLLLVGFPVALIFAWTQELNAGALAERAPTGKADWILTGALGVVIVLILYEQFAPRPSARPVPQASVTPATPPQPAGIALAVLPFVNLSGDASQEFFSDGITEEITSALAKVQGLKVIGRTSAFQFKGQNQDLRAIGQALSVGYLIEGSVRKAGDQVRITAQLIKADDGTHLWTENYDRQLVNIFATQDDIAQAIAGALRVPLGLQQGESLVSNRTDDLESYQQYLRARVLYRALDTAKAIEILESTVARDRGFAAAWGLLAQAYVRAGLTLTPGQEKASFGKAEKAGREGIRLDGRNASAYAALADMDFLLGRWTAGEDGFRKALALDPGEPDIINRYSIHLAIAGHIKDALQLREQLTAIEPFVPTFNTNTARFLVSLGQTQAAIAIVQNNPVTVNGSVALARAYAKEGRYAEAAEALLSVPQTTYFRRSAEDAASLLRSAPNTRPPESLPVLVGQLHFVYLHVGALGRILDEPERALRNGDPMGVTLDALWQSEAAPVRKTERFKTFVRKAGLVDYWKARGWPDLCRPQGADDFVCD